MSTRMQLVVGAVAPLAALVVAGTSVAAGTHRTVSHNAAVTAKVTVTFDDRKLALSPSGLEAGPTVFVAVNRGTRPHSLAIAGPGLKGIHTGRVAPGKSVTVAVTLRSGAYMVTFSDPLGLGMAATRWVQVIPRTVVTARGNGSVVNPGGDTSMCGYLAP
jgi:hypothetical protein